MRKLVLLCSAVVAWPTLLFAEGLVGTAKPNVSLACVEIDASGAEVPSSSCYYSCSTSFNSSGVPPKREGDGFLLENVSRVEFYYDRLRGGGDARFWIAYKQQATDNRVEKVGVLYVGSTMNCGRVPIVDTVQGKKLYFRIDKFDPISQ